MRLTDVSIITRLFRPLGKLYKARKHNLAAKKSKFLLQDLHRSKNRLMCNVSQVFREIQN